MSPTPPFDPEAVDERGRKLRKPVYNYVHIRARAKTYVALENWDAALADAEEVANFLTSKGGWMSMRPVELDEAEQLKRINLFTLKHNVLNHCVLNAVQNPINFVVR